MITDAVEEIADEDPVRRVAVRIPESLELELHSRARDGHTKSSIVTAALYAYFQKDGLAVLKPDAWDPSLPRRDVDEAFLLDTFGEQGTEFWKDLSAACRKLRAAAAEAGGPHDHDR